MPALAACRRDDVTRYVDERQLGKHCSVIKMWIQGFSPSLTSKRLGRLAPMDTCRHGVTGQTFTDAIEVCLLNFLFDLYSRFPSSTTRSVAFALVFLASRPICSLNSHRLKDRGR